MEHGERLSDQDLVRRFADAGDESALAEIISRHSPMAYSAAARMLGDPSSAEDAVQATFVVLSRKASGLSGGVVPAGWIYRTVCFISRRMLQERARRARREREAVAMKSATRSPETSWDDLRPELDEAICTLPARYRDVVALHYLGGRSRREVACELGCPEKTVETRLHRAVERLRGKLARRGSSIGAGVLAAFLAENTLEAAPAGLAASVTAVCTGKAAGSGTVISLAEGAIKMMMIAKMKLVAVCVAVAVATGGVAVPLAVRAMGGGSTRGGTAAAAETTLPGSVYGKFNGFCIEHFGAEKEPLVYTKFGKDLNFMRDGLWQHVSERSCCIGFETNLPAKAHVEYGQTKRYGGKTSEHERPFYLHLHYLKDLKPDTTYHCRLVAVDERGNKAVTKDAVFSTKAIPGAIHVPGTMAGPPYVLDKAGATYIVTKDIATDVTALKVTAANVTLDLGGHTVQYNTRKLGKVGDNFNEYIENGSQGVLALKANRMRLLNGTIRQGSGDDDAGSYSVGFSPVHTKHSNDLELAGLTVQYGSRQKVGIYNHWGAKNSEFHHNVFIDTGSEVLNRHGNGCTALLCGEKDGSDNIRTHHNLVKRTRQFGLSGKELYSNEIYIDSRSTNSFGVRRYSTKTARDNRIFGTGFFPMAAAWGTQQTFQDNFIHLEGQNPIVAKSYGEDAKRCNLLGFRLTQYGGSKEPLENDLYHDNVVIIRVRDGSAGCGTWFCSDASVKGLVFRNNTVKVVAMDQKPITTKYPAIACVAAQGDHKLTDQHLPIIYRDNTFVANINHISFGSRYATGSNHHFYGCKFVKVGNDPRYKTFRWANAYPCKNHVIRDPVFKGGAGLDSISFGDGDHDLTVQWTLTVKTAAGAKVTITDKSGREVFAGTADEKGVASAPLSQYLHSAKGKTYFTPHRVKVEKAGRATQKTVTMDRKQELGAKL